MNERKPNPRLTEAEVDCTFPDRWSPRAFIEEPLPPRQVHSLFEAARWAPSCFNDQPWLFVYAVSPGDRARFADALLPKNRSWAARAPLLCFVFARREFEGSGKENRHAAYDTGAAWMSLALQARRLGLYAHAMAGFDQQKAYAAAGVPAETFHVMAAVAVGRLGDPAVLPDDLRAMEAPNPRKPLAEVAVEGRYGGAGDEG